GIAAAALVDRGAAVAGGGGRGGDVAAGGEGIEEARLGGLGPAAAGAADQLRAVLAAVESGGGGRSRGSAAIGHVRDMFFLARDVKRNVPYRLCWGGAGYSRGLDGGGGLGSDGGRRSGGSP